MDEVDEVGNIEEVEDSEDIEFIDEGQIDNGSRPTEPQHEKKARKRAVRPDRHYTIVDAIYFDEQGTRHEIAGVPEYNTDKYGDYWGRYPYIAASKAFTGIQKHMKKFEKQRKGQLWFPNYDPDKPPIVIFIIQDVLTGKNYAYQGQRVRAPQSRDAPRIIQNADGRTRIYNWVNDIIPLKGVIEE